VSSVKAYLELARWPNALIAAFGVLVGARVSMAGPALVYPAVWFAMVAAVALTVAANAWNDAADAELDQRAGSARPIATGAISVRSADRVASFAAAIGTAFAALAVPALGLITLPVVALMRFYSPWIKRFGLAGNATVAVLASLPFVYGGWSRGNAINGLYLTGAAVPLHLAREITKDIDDVHADAGLRRTVPMLIGARRARWLVAGIVVSYVVAMFASFELVREIRYWLLPTIALLAVALNLILSGQAGGSSALKAAMLVAMFTLWYFAIVVSP
jgi:4-hydroxybenzoate polyprenyltransferase